ncbi:TPA: hypothetical protein ACH3X2_008308 [Trebouxia sp. C0005]
MRSFYTKMLLAVRQKNAVIPNPSCWAVTQSLAPGHTHRLTGELDVEGQHNKNFSECIMIKTPQLDVLTPIPPCSVPSDRHSKNKVLITSSTASTASLWQDRHQLMPAHLRECNQRIDMV